MSDTRVAELNDFARHKHPGLVGVEVLTCDAEGVTGRMSVTEPVVAGTGFLWAPVVITLESSWARTNVPVKNSTVKTMIFFITSLDLSYSCYNTTSFSNFDVCILVNVDLTVIL